MPFLKSSLLTIAMIACCNASYSQDVEFQTECDVVNYLLNVPDVYNFIVKGPYRGLPAPNYSDTAILTMIDADRVLTKCGINSWRRNKLSLITTGKKAELVKKHGPTGIVDTSSFAFMRLASVKVKPQYGFAVVCGNGILMAWIELCRENGRYQLHRLKSMDYWE